MYQQSGYFSTRVFDLQLPGNGDITDRQTSFVRRDTASL
jgi:hypothetical protein